MKPNYIPIKSVLKAYGELIGWLAADPTIKKVTKYFNPKYVAKATRHGKPDNRFKTMHMVVTLGAPNFRERKFIRTLIKAKCEFPINRIQIVREKK